MEGWVEIMKIRGWKVVLIDDEGTYQDFNVHLPPAVYDGVDNLLKELGYDIDWGADI